MVDPIDENGKKTDMSGNTLWVVAGALQRPDGHILMHKRPLGKQHGGLWEYPGGKVEEAEVPVKKSTSPSFPADATSMPGAVISTFSPRLENPR